MLPFRSIFFLAIFSLAQLAPSQEVLEVSGSHVSGGEQNSMSLPFRMVNKLILIPVQINGSDTLQFILDTGLENSIICELGVDETLELKQAREIQVRGFGSGNMIDAIQSTGNSLNVGKMTIPNQDYVILSNNVLELSCKMGTRIHGLMNLRAFKDFVIEIDYERELITLYKPGFFRKHKNLDSYASLQMEINRGSPYIDLTVITDNGSIYPVKLMLDTGAGNALCLDIGSVSAYSMPEGSRDCFLGCSINGDIKGKVGRMEQVKIGPYHLQEVLVSYPDSQVIAINEPVPGRNGSLGSEFLRRFNLIIDFPDKKVHILPNKAFSQPFHYDMSGLEILVPVPDEHRYIISGIRKQSNAALAGIKSGDEILYLNGIHASQYTLDDIYKSLSGNISKKVKMELLREGKRIKANFRLKKYI